MKRSLAMIVSMILILTSALIGSRSPAMAAGRQSDVAAGRQGYVAPPQTKINVMGEWAHPDDDTSIIGPCGVWHQRYGTKCGVIQITRGEGGGNATGPETGTALGLRRENEDRVAHDRSGTLDMFYVDKVDFFYNQSAPLTEQLWDQNDTLRRVTRIVRTTQPDVFIGFTPTLAAGHGNHQESGRLIWEAVQAAADPTMFPDQLRGANALSTWQVKKVFSGGSTAGTGGSTTGPACTTGFLPAQGNTSTVSGVWTGYDSPYRWPEGNVQKQPAGSAKIWQQVADEGRSAYPTQSRVMYMGTSQPACPKFGMTESFVPFQPNARLDGSANPAAGTDDAILAGAVRQDPGGLPLGTLEYLTFSRFFNVPGVPFTATLHLRAPADASLPAGTATVRAPQGWTVSAARPVASLKAGAGAVYDFTVTPPADAPSGSMPAADVSVSATVQSARASGYTDNAVHLVPAVEGRFQRWGKWADYDDWLATRAPAARRLGRSAAVQSVALGGKVSVPVVLTNRSASSRSGEVSLTLPDGFTADRTSQSYGPLAAGASTTVSFTVTDTNSTLPTDQQVQLPITTTFTSGADSGSGSGSESLALSVVPTTAIGQAGADPVVDAKASAAEYPGAELDLGRIWQGATYCTGAADCGNSVGTGGSADDHSWAKVSWRDDALYLFAHIRDDYQSYAITPGECVAHWLADSVEFQIDPRGNASADALDTANTFKLGVFPFTDDPTNSNGNGVNGPCWERDADNHQGYATGPLAKTVAQAPNAAGVEVASSATWVGSNDTGVDHAYAGGGYDIEVKVPMADLPAAIDPQHMGLNITPYDEDNTAAAGSTTLRHIDNSARLGWSAFNSVQSDPYRWGRATLTGYTPPSGRSTTPGQAIVGHPNLDGTLSPQTIAQSARNGVPIAGREPVRARDSITVTKVRLRGNKISATITSTGAGTANLFAFSGDESQIPVWTTSCSEADDPAPDYGLTACAAGDGTTPTWSPDMAGHLHAGETVPVKAGSQTVSGTLSAARADKLRADGHVLASFVDRAGRVQALNVPIG